MNRNFPSTEAIRSAAFGSIGVQVYKVVASMRTAPPSGGQSPRYQSMPRPQCSSLAKKFGSFSRHALISGCWTK